MLQYFPIKMGEEKKLSKSVSGYLKTKKRRRKKVPVAIKPKGEGEGGKALMARPLREDL